MTTTTSSHVAADPFSAAERAAMKDRAAEARAEGRRRSRQDKAAADRQDVLATIAELPEPDRSIAERLHAIVTTVAPALAPKLWYGMPAYARDGKVVCFFQSRDKFKTRYATLGFADAAHLDDGTLWPVSYALIALTEADEARVSALVEHAVA